MHRLGSINILGVEYGLYQHQDYHELNELERKLDIKYDLNFKADSPYKNVMGFCDILAKEIHVFTETSIDYRDNTFNHELWHALLYESGYSHWSDEEFIEKLACWYPRMEELMKQLHALKENMKVKIVEEKVNFDDMIQKEEVGCLNISKGKNVEA